MKNEQDILSAIAGDRWMLDVLDAAAALKLPDWWVCAGFVRSKVWDVMHNYIERTPLGDIDVIFYDTENLEEEMEKELEYQLHIRIPNLPWSVKNQARMHKVNNLPPYLSSVDAISRFPETATAIGVKLNRRGEPELTAPHGLTDLLAIKVIPTPSFEKDENLMKIYRHRLVSKNWKHKWPKVQVMSASENKKKG